MVWVHIISVQTSVFLYVWSLWWNLIKMRFKFIPILTISSEEYWPLIRLQQCSAHCSVIPIFRPMQLSFSCWVHLLKWGVVGHIVASLLSQGNRKRLWHWLQQTFSGKVSSGGAQGAGCSHGSLYETHTAFCSDDNLRSSCNKNWNEEEISCQTSVKFRRITYVK